jgi:hypothetical protein
VRGLPHAAGELAQLLDRAGALGDRGVQRLRVGILLRQLPCRWRSARPIDASRCSAPLRKRKSSPLGRVRDEGVEQAGNASSISALRRGVHPRGADAVLLP